MIDRQTRDRVENAFMNLERSGDTFTKKGLTESLAYSDSRYWPGLEAIFYNAYAYEIENKWKDRVTLAELFGIGSVSEEHRELTMSRFYAINAQHERRATRHMSPDELAYVAEIQDTKSRNLARDANTTRIAREVVIQKSKTL